MMSVPEISESALRACHARSGARTRGEACAGSGTAIAARLQFIETPERCDHLLTGQLDISVGMVGWMTGLPREG